MVRAAARLASKKALLVCVMVSLLIAAGPFQGQAFAAEPQPRSLVVSNSMAAATGVTYRASFHYMTTGNVGSVSILFCDNAAIVDVPCNPPVGFDASNVVTGVQLGVVGYSLYPGSTANNIILSRPPANVTGGSIGVYDFDLINNPTNPGPMYARIYTYPTSDASGPYTDAGGLALYFDGSVGVNAEVPPYLTFCLGESITGTNCATATEPFSDLGTLSPVVTSAAQSQVLIATNADNGYTMWAQGSTMTSGNNVLPAMAGTASQKGTSQFGINLRANTNPVVGQDPSGPGVAGVTAGYSQQNQYRFNSGDALATTGNPDDFRKYTVSYIVNIDPNQPGGVYSTTLTYVCLANF